MWGRDWGGQDAHFLGLLFLDAGLGGETGRHFVTKGCSVVFIEGLEWFGVILFFSSLYIVFIGGLEWFGFFFIFINCF
jgi:hypothetical protein